MTRLLSVALLPLAFAGRAAPRARQAACQWALAARFPAENLDGLTPATRAAFEAARTEALWRHGELIGLTDGYRDPQAQARLFAAAVRRTGSPALARYWTLPPHESGHVAGIALDVRPAEGARWLERHGLEAPPVPRLRQRVVALRVPAGRPSGAPAAPGGVS